MESEKVGILEIGDIVMVKETRVNEANTTRVSFERGWTNATMTDGRQVLSPLTRKQQAPVLVFILALLDPPTSRPPLRVLILHVSQARLDGKYVT